MNELAHSLDTLVRDADQDKLIEESYSDIDLIGHLDRLDELIEEDIGFMPLPWSSTKKYN